MYFDSEGHVVATKAIVVTKKGSRTVISRSVRTLLQYGDPQPLSDETVALLGRRWQPCTLSFILNGGGVAYAWLVPGELPGVNHGGLAYRFNAASGVCPTATYNLARAL